jgi:hypothetical protein
MGVENRTQPYNALVENMLVLDHAEARIYGHCPLHGTVETLSIRNGFSDKFYKESIDMVDRVMDMHDEEFHNRQGALYIYTVSYS